MSSSIGEMMSQFTDLYNAGSYQAALTLINHEIANYPSHHVALLCFTAAMSARLGDTASALAIFQTALDKGYWYHEGALQSDPDFASLQAETEFKMIVEQNAQRRQTALANVKPLLRVLEPAASGNPAPLLIALHGNFSNADEHAAYWQIAVEQGWRVALPQSSCVRAG